MFEQKGCFGRVHTLRRYPQGRWQCLLAANSVAVIPRKSRATAEMVSEEQDAGHSPERDGGGSKCSMTTTVPGPADNVNEIAFQRAINAADLVAWQFSQ